MDESKSQPVSGTGAALRGLRCVVTGASSGIGRGTAIRLAREGASLLLHARKNRAGLNETLELVRGAGAEQGSYETVLADLAESDRCLDLVETAWSWGGSIDAWIHLAGADVLTGEARGWSFDRKLETLWRTDVVGTLITTREVGRRMAADRRTGVASEENTADANRPLPTIVTVGWDQTAHGMAGDAGEMFGAIKGAVTAFSLSLARSLAPHVRVVNVAPGWIRTAWGTTADPYWERRAREESLLGRWGSVDDVAGTIAFLVSPAAGFLTGQVVPINGGFRHPFDPAG